MADSTVVQRIGSATPQWDVKERCNKTLKQSLVFADCPDENEGWLDMILHRLLEAKCSDEKGHLSVEHLRHTRWIEVFLYIRLCKWLLAGWHQWGRAPKNGFTTSEGLFEVKVMSFGLCNVPATFHHPMDWVLKDLQWKRVWFTLMI